MFKLDYNNIPFDFVENKKTFTCCGKESSSKFCPDCKRVFFEGKPVGFLIKGILKEDPSIYYGYKTVLEEISKKRNLNLGDLRKEVLKEDNLEEYFSSKESKMNTTKEGRIIQEIRNLVYGEEIVSILDTPTRSEVLDFIKANKLSEGVMEALITKVSGL